MNTLLFRLGRYGTRLPASLWWRAVGRVGRRAARRLAGLSADHRRIRRLAVTEIIRTGHPVTPERLGADAGVDATRVPGLLDDLEREKVFLFRGDGSAVNWAYPVTAEETPHRIRLETGERFFASSGLDALGLPVVHGGLSDPNVCAVIGSACACCERPIELIIDASLGFRVLTEDAHPVVSVPLIDVTRIDRPSIIKEYCRRSLFFWSEDHIGQYRERISGAYPGIGHAAEAARIAHGTLFGL